MISEDRRTIRENLGYAVILGIGIMGFSYSSYVLGRVQGHKKGIEHSIEILESRIRSVGEQGRYVNSMKEGDEILDYCQGLSRAIDVLEELREIK